MTGMFRAGEPCREPQPWTKGVYRRARQCGPERLSQGLSSGVSALVGATGIERNLAFARYPGWITDCRIRKYWGRSDFERRVSAPTGRYAVPYPRKFQ